MIRLLDTKTNVHRNNEKKVSGSKTDDIMLKNIFVTRIFLVSKIREGERERAV